MKEVFVKGAEAADAAAEAVQGVVGAVHDVTKLDRLLLQILEQIQILLRGRYAHCIKTEVNVGA